jgi:outer membrane biosynthesis protein TonB
MRSSNWIRWIERGVLLGLVAFMTMGAGWSQSDTSTAESKTEDSVFALQSEGPRSDEEIQEVIRRYHPVLQNYYQRELKTNPLLHGVLKIRLIIRPDGSVSTATVLENTVGNSKLAWSAQQHCMRWQFKQGVSAIHTVDVTIPFEPT